ncbi:MAG: tetratricopeptide repeat protein [Deltaproteobacteria bacterium]|nr:tetratricopeptide repeat protein [Deltaproteobacteria bacterium]
MEKKLKKTGYEKPKQGGDLPKWRQEDWVANRLRARKRKTRMGIVSVGVFLVLAYLGAAFLVRMFPFDVRQELGLNAVLFEVNGVSVSVEPGQTLEVNNSDTVKLVRIDSNAVFDWSLDFTSEVFSREALLNGSRVDEALGESSWMLEGTKPIQMVYRGDVIGQVNVKVVGDEKYWWLRSQRSADPAEKILMLEKALSLNSSSVSTRESLADLYEKTGNWRKAAEFYEWIAERDTRPIWLNKMVELYRGNGDLKSQAQAFERAVAINPDAKYLVLTAQAFEELKNSEKAVPYYEKAVPSLQGAERAAVLKKLGYYYVEKKELKKAVQMYEQASKLDPEDPNVFFNLGELYHRMGETDASINALEKANSLRADDRETIILLVSSYEKKGDYRGLVPHLEKLIQETPEDIDLMLKLASAHEKLGDTTGALSAYEVIAKLAPENPEVLYNLGRLYFMRRNYRKSEEALMRALALDPDHPKANSYLFDIYKRTGRRDKAISTAERQLEIDPRDRPVYDYLFRELKDERPEALKVVLTEGVEALPGDGRLREYLGVVYLKEQNIAYATIQFEHASELHPQDVSILYQLAKLYERTGQLDLSLKFYQRVIDIDEGYRDAEQSFLRLRYSRIKKSDQDGKGAPGT